MCYPLPMNAIESLRSEYQVAGELESQRKFVTHLRDLAAEFMALDVRPLLIHEHTVERIGPSPIPSELQDMLSTESAKLGALEYEFHTRRRRL